MSGANFLICDEISTMLDVITQAQIWNKILEEAAAQNMGLIAVTHNRARGTHLLEPMKAIVKRLLADGKSVQEIGKQLGMRPEEVFRLSDFSRDDFLSMMTKGVHGYSKAELLTKY